MILRGAKVFRLWFEFINVDTFLLRIIGLGVLQVQNSRALVEIIVILGDRNDRAETYRKHLLNLMATSLS